MSFDHFGFGVLVLASFVLVVFVFSVFVFRVLVGDVFGITESGGVFCAFVGGVGFEFGAIRGAMLFHFFGFILGEFRLGGSLIFGGVEVSFFLAVLFFRFLFRKFGLGRGVNFFRFVLFELGAAGKGIGFGVVGGFFVFCFRQFECERCGLLFVQFGVGAERLGWA